MENQPSKFKTLFIAAILIGAAWGHAVVLAARTGDGDAAGAWALVFFEPFILGFGLICFFKLKHHFTSLVCLGAVLFHAYVICDIWYLS